MTIIHEGPSRMRSVRGPMNGPVQLPRTSTSTSTSTSRAGLAPSRRPRPARPAGAPLRYHGTGVAMSTAPHGPRAVTVATTVGLALVAGLITLWLGLVGHFGDVTNGNSASAQVPDRLAVVRVETGETLQDVAARVAPDAPVRQVVERIRELNAMDSNSLAAGQTLIAPVG